MVLTSAKLGSSSSELGIFELGTKSSSCSPSARPLPFWSFGKKIGEVGRGRGNAKRPCSRLGKSKAEALAIGGSCPLPSSPFQYQSKSVQINLPLSRSNVLRDICISEIVTFTGHICTWRRDQNFNTRGSILKARKSRAQTRSTRLWWLLYFVL